MIRASSQKQARQIFGPLIMVCLMIYFVYHIFQGERGVLSWLRLKQKITESEIVLAEKKNQKEILERQVYLLRPDSLDMDMLEERARIVLNFAGKNDIIVKE